MASFTLQSARDTVALVQHAEDAGFWGAGLVDTAPRLYQAVYPTVTACLLATKRIQVGPYVTNPVSQHWSVHGSTIRTLDELAPRRAFIGIATGDGAVHSVGLDPVAPAAFETAIKEMKTLIPGGVGVHVAASGPRAIEVGGRVGTDLTICVGLDVPALRTLGERAIAARAAAGVSAQLRLWTAAPMLLVASPSELPAARASMRALAVGMARLNFARGRFEGKNVPSEWQPLLRERLTRYDFGTHGVAHAENPNGALFADHPRIERYLLERMLLIDTPAGAAERLTVLAHDAHLDGVVLNITAPPGASLVEQVALGSEVVERVAAVAG